MWERRASFDLKTRSEWALASTYRALRSRSSSASPGRRVNLSVPRERRELNRGHSASFSEPPATNCRRHTGNLASIFARNALCDLTPESVSMLTTRYRRSAGRAHWWSNNTPSLLLSTYGHRMSSSLRCCDDRLNSPSTPRLPSGYAAGAPVCDPRWVR